MNIGHIHYSKDINSKIGVILELEKNDFLKYNFRFKNLKVDIV